MRKYRRPLAAILLKLIFPYWLYLLSQKWLRLVHNFQQADNIALHHCTWQHNDTQFVPSYPWYSKFVENGHRENWKGIFKHIITNQFVSPKSLLDNVSMAINDCFMQNGRSSCFFLGNSIFFAVEQRFQTFQIAFLYSFVYAFDFLLKMKSWIIFLKHYINDFF